MSVIFSSDNLYSKKCPLCRAHRSKESRSWVKFTCKSCGFWMHFRDSFDDEPDPLTWTALCEIRESGFCEFIREGELFMDMQGFLNPNVNKSRLKKLIIQTWPADTEDPRSQQCPSIRHFPAAILKTHKALEEAMSGVKKDLPIINQGTGLLFQDSSRMIGGRFMLGITPEYENLVRSIWTYYRDCKTGVVSSEDLLRILKDFSECLLDSRLQYHPYCLAAVRISCLLWIIFFVLDLEAKTLLPISKFLARMYPTNAESMEHPLFLKIVSPLWVPHVLIGRFTFDLAHDIKALVSPNEPQYEFAAVCRILQESRTLWLHFLSEGNLDEYDLDLTPECFFNQSIFTSQGVLDNWLEKYRRTLEGMLARSGRGERASSICEHCPFFQEP
ncbi:hypothetical protein BDV41DRAFT_565134 [Aspergillus transmontanensis]|uniref:Uncharacterized protein n=1 Tax=Aspergillus transmontanensis TaxID=1034304 RepID=A0A5N6VVP8_9EURO|nr:hypothetical protein BDV41DRAFT_565134 [Aspergillus transmontanensis]